MKKVLMIVFIIVLAFALVACGEVGADLSLVMNSSEKGSMEGLPAIDGDYYAEFGDTGSKSLIGKADCAIDGGTEEADEKKEIESVQAGQLTAKAWNDNENYEKWKSLFNEETANDERGKFFDYKTGVAARDTLNRVKITVTEGENKVFGAKIVYFDAAQKECVVRTDVNGIAYLFPSEESGTIRVSSGSGEATATFTKENREPAVDLSESKGKANVIKMMFVIDATGSMGDEMRYLTAELADVVERVTRKAEQVKIDLALLFYRDDGDEEKFAYSDFQTVSEKSGMDKQIGVLSKQYATGGGDYPEALDEALELSMGKDWGVENATRLTFVVLDAPPHQEEQTLARYAAAVESAAAKGIAICPILCSGADALCEYVTRTAAIMTGGTSIFVTDDSGIGGSHRDPDLPDAVVERLNDLLVRLIVGYHTGDFGEAKPWKGNEGQSQAGALDPVEESTKVDAPTEDAPIDPANASATERELDKRGTTEADPTKEIK